MTQPRSGRSHGPATPRAAWARRHKAPAALLAALVLVLAIGITLQSIGGSHPAGGAAGAGPSAAPEVAAATGGARWITGPAGQLLRAVSADLGRLSAAQRSGRQGAAQRAGTQRAGTQLAAAARAALAGPMPPADAKIYRSALNGFERAGMYIMNGEFGKANTLLNAGDIDIAKVTSTANRPARVRHRDAVSEPNGQ